jgi:predicted DsbA family dithiol-disulfide isomerase
MNKLQIDIVSDIACPWCAIGYARLEQAMAQLGDDYECHVQWHAFELNPTHDGQGEPILPALARKYGRSEEEMRAGQSQMMAIAKDLGINFEKLQERYTCNTFDAHRLVKWANQYDQQTAMKQALFETYFGKGLDVSDQQNLLACVEQAGLDVDLARQVLESEQFANEVREDEAKYQGAGVSSVPAFIINNKYLISGAQEPETFAKALKDISEEGRQAG